MWVKAALAALKRDFRYTLYSGHCLPACARPKGANKRHRKLEQPAGAAVAPFYFVVTVRLAL
jgi:hypothetical protein